jgi:flagellar protein FliS
MYPATLRTAASAYGAAANTLPPANQIVMLFDGAIRFLRTAREACDEKRVEARHEAVVKAHRIVDALQACLDHERGGELAASLSNIYTYILFRLPQIDLKNDASICEELIARLSELRGAWATLATGQAAARPAEPALALVGGISA